jgi:hypothetical protein
MWIRLPSPIEPDGLIALATGQQALQRVELLTRTNTA